MSAGGARVCGLAGKCCAGKDLVTAELERRGWRQLDVDAIGHRALTARHGAVVQAFGRAILGHHDTIDRRKLGRIVFRDSKQRARLEAIVHPWMRARVRERIDAFRAAPDAVGLVINAAVLFAMRLDAWCDFVILVRAPLLHRLRRARRRDGAGWMVTLGRLRAQAGIDAQARSSVAETLVVTNSGTRDRLKLELDRLGVFGTGT